MNEYIIEFMQMGRSVKVTVINPDTGREVSIVGDANLSQESLTRAAVRKMEYVMGKEKPL